MEKKTIGKFISTLRKANGMTQKELGEKLFVSDKTVSRWECDECTPELSLIPSIAELFGISTDELLRGERNNPDREAVISEDAVNKQKAKSNKRFKLMLDRKNREYKNLTLICVGIAILGFITAMIADLGFSKGWIAFGLAVAFFAASEICQICFAINARIAPDEDDDTYADRIQKANTSVIKTAVAISLMNLLLFTFCLPLVTQIDGASGGLAFGSWLGYGCLYTAIVSFLCYIIYTLFARKILCARGLITLDDKQKEEIEQNKRLLTKALSVATVISLALGVCIVAWYMIGWEAFLEKNTFDNCNDFKAFMESDYDNWYRDTYGQVMLNGEAVAIPPSSPDYPHEAFGHQKIYGGIQNSKGEEICVYCYNPDLYWQIEFTPSSDDKMPVTVITNQAVYAARNIFQTVETVLYALIALAFVAAVGFHVIKVYGKKKEK